MRETPAQTRNRKCKVRNNFQKSKPRMFEMTQVHDSLAFWIFKDSDLFPVSIFEFRIPRELCAHRNTRGPFELAPAYPRTFDRAQNRLQNAVTQHWPINQAHRQD